LGNHVKVQKCGKDRFRICPRGGDRSTAWARLRNLAQQLGIELEFSSKSLATRCAEVVGMHIAGTPVPIPEEIKKDQVP
jgi:hypothetical protein